MAKIKHATLIEEFEDTNFFDLQLQITHLVSSNSSINVSFSILAIVLSVPL
jgi:hypothetical protein